MGPKVALITGVAEALAKEVPVVGQYHRAIDERQLSTENFITVHGRGTHTGSSSFRDVASLSIAIGMGPQARAIENLRVAASVVSQDAVRRISMPMPAELAELLGGVFAKEPESYLISHVAPSPEPEGALTAGLDAIEGFARLLAEVRALSDEDLVRLGPDGATVTLRMGAGFFSMTIAVRSPDAKLVLETLFVIPRAPEAQPGLEHLAVFNLPVLAKLAALAAPESATGSTVLSSAAKSADVEGGGTPPRNAPRNPRKPPSKAASSFTTSKPTKRRRAIQPGGSLLVGLLPETSFPRRVLSHDEPEYCPAAP